MFKVTLEDGKYTVTNDNGVLKIYRPTEVNSAWHEALAKDGMVLAMMREIEDLSLRLEGLDNPEKPEPKWFDIVNRKTGETIATTTKPEVMAGMAEGAILGMSVKVWAIVVGGQAIPVNMAYLAPLPKGFPVEAGR